MYGKVETGPTHINLFEEPGIQPNSDGKPIHNVSYKLVSTDGSGNIKEMALAKKPIGAICIAPALVAAVLGKEYAPSVTIGTDSGTATAIFQTGSSHVECSATDFVVDKKHKIVSTPAYMLAKNISEAAVGIEKAVKAVLELI